MVSYLAGFSLPLFGTVFGKLLVQLHINVFIICEERATGTYSLEVICKRTFMLQCAVGNPP